MVVCVIASSAEKTTSALRPTFASPTMGSTHAKLAGEPVDLTPREFDLLCFFASNPDKVFSRSELLDRVWGHRHGGYEHTVNTHINRIRAKIEIDPEAHTIFLPSQGMRLDVRGAAKGFALDRMKEAMTEAGATAGIMDFSGEMLFFGPGPENGRWPIQLKDPYDPSRGYAYLLLPAGGLSTSNFYDRSVEIGGRRYGHVIDPRTGQR